MSKAKTTSKKSTFAFTIPPVKNIPPTKKGFPIPKEEMDLVKQLRELKLVFSFRFLDRQHELFNLGKTELSWFISLIDTLKEVSGLTRNQLVVEQREHYDAHGHNWDEVSPKYNFNDEFLSQVECMQFSLSKSRGRVHGFVIGNRFYIVWLDRHHNLYPMEQHGGRKYYCGAQSCYEELLEKYNKLQQDYEAACELLKMEP